MASPSDEPPSLSRLAELKAYMHERVGLRVDVAQLGFHSSEAVRREVYHSVEEACRNDLPDLAPSDRLRLVQELMQDLFGLGPLEPLVFDPTINDILVNGPMRVYVDRGGVLEPTPTRFYDDAHLVGVVQRIAASVGRHVDARHPVLDARLPDGSRVNAILPPLAIDGTVLSIRRFGRTPLTMEGLLALGAMTGEMAMLLEAAIKSRLNVLVSGGTGSGKTTLLNALSSFVPKSQRIVTIEDAAELRLQQEHVVRLETRPPDLDGEGAFSARDLFRNALRMRPDRIIVGECRGVEAFDMLQAMNTGHEGSMTTLHANSPRDALARLENMILLAGLGTPVRALRQQIASALDLVVQTSRLAGGARRITSITEVLGLEQEVITMQELFSFRQTGVDASDRAHGQFECSGVRPKLMAKLELAGHRLPPNLFQQRVLARA